MKFSFETGRNVIRILNCIGDGEKKIKTIRESLINNSQMNFDIVKIFGNIASGNNEIGAKNIQDFLYALLKEKFEYNDIELMIFFNSGKGKKEMNIYELLKVLTGNYSQWFRDYNNYKFDFNVYRYDIAFDQESGVCMLLKEEIELHQLIRFYLALLKKRKDFNVNLAFELMREKLSNSVTIDSLRKFYSDYLCDSIMDSELIMILNRIDFDQDGVVSFKDIIRLFDVGGNQYEENPINNKKDIVNSEYLSDELEEKFILYLKEVCKQEKTIEIAKINFFQSHSEFSIRKLYNLMLVNKFGDNIPLNTIPLSLSKIGVYLSQEEIYLLSRRIEHFEQTNITIDNLHTLLVPYFRRDVIPIDIQDKSQIILQITTNDLKELFYTIVNSEKRINEMKRNSLYKYFISKNIDVLFNAIISSVNIPYLTLATFFHYCIKKGIVNYSLNKNDIELVYNRLNKSHNNHLTIVDLKNELSYI